MVDSAFTSLAGELLLAMPGIGDPRFDQAVIAMCLHQPEGAMGIGIGRIVPGITLHTLLKQLDIETEGAPDAPVHVGGPVEQQRGFVLHSPDWKGEDTLAVTPQLCLSTTLDVLRAIARGEGPERWLVALGYAGWGESQLDEELSRHGWMSLPGNDELIFETPVKQRWPRAFSTAGIDVRLLAPTSGRA
jgi:putative transcriptional regulator